MFITVVVGIIWLIKILFYESTYDGKCGHLFAPPGYNSGICELEQKMKEKPVGKISKEVGYYQFVSLAPWEKFSIDFYSEINLSEYEGIEIKIIDSEVIIDRKIEIAFTLNCNNYQN